MKSFWSEKLELTEKSLQGHKGVEGSGGNWITAIFGSKRLIQLLSPFTPPLPPNDKHCVIVILWYFNAVMKDFFFWFVRKKELKGSLYKVSLCHNFPEIMWSFAMKMEILGWAFGTMVMMLTLHTGVPAPLPGQLPTNAHRGRQQVVVQCVGPFQPSANLDHVPGFGLSPGCWYHLRSKPAHRTLFFSLSVSLLCK